ncbi:MAG: winged helix-turn-helix domain-containing tetratricopeptide repeat protein [Hydrogenophaga sp.]
MNNCLRFGRYEWRPASRQLLADGSPVALGSRALDLLGVLLANRDKLMTKGELLSQAWPGLIVEENNLSVQISALRKVLGEDTVCTVPGRGYQWVEPVAEGEPIITLKRTKPSIAVLPFANMTGQPEQDYLADGLSEDITASLTHSPWIFVVASGSSLQFRSVQASVQETCNQLHVQYLLRGSIQRAAEHLRIKAELIDGTTGGVVWAEKYDRPCVDFFAVQDEITAKIVGTIEPAFLKQEEKRAANRPERDLQQWDLVMRARWHYWRSSQRHSKEARNLLEQALRLRPNDANALSLLAFCLATEVWSGWAAEPKVTAIEARRLATRAVALDDADAFAHFALGVTLLSFGEIDAAIAEHRYALALYPHFAAAAAELGRLLSFSGQTLEGRRLMRQAMDDSPTDPRMALWRFGLGIASFVDAGYEDAIEHARSAITLRRDWFFNHMLLATCAAHLGDLALARASLAEGVRLVPTLTVAAIRVGHPFKNNTDHERYIAGLRAAGWTYQEKNP